MEDRRRKNSSSGDKFSFPIIIPPAQDFDQFEFGSVTTPGSPKSPADHLFFNGKLLPHAFPIQQPNNFTYSRSTSRTSSKDSLMSSRSNSTNSRSSNCSSARTSTSEASERRFSPAAVDGNVSSRPSSARRERNRPVLSSQYQRWQLIAAAPVLHHQGSISRSRKIDQNILERKESKKKSARAGIEEDSGAGAGAGAGAKSWFGRRIMKSFVSACKECHAIETSSVEGALPRRLEL